MELKSSLAPLLASLLGVTLAATACNPERRARLPEAVGDITPAPPATPTPPTPASPTPASPTPASPTPASPATPANAAPEPDAITLERSPGLTPALPDTTFPTPANAPDLPGQGGPSPAMGPENAPVVVFVFSDFQCPVCRRAVEPLKKLVRAHDPLVRVVFKHQALAMHDRARATAVASLAAFKHQRFFAFHDRVFEAAHDLSDAALEAHAEAVGVPLDAFRAALNDANLGAQVDRESAIGERLGVRGTPGFVVNGDVSVGWGSYLALEHPVKEAIAAFRASGLPASLATARTLTAQKNADAASLLFPAAP